MWQDGAYRIIGGTVPFGTGVFFGTSSTRTGLMAGRALSGSLRRKARLGCEQLEDRRLLAIVVGPGGEEIDDGRVVTPYLAQQRHLMSPSGGFLTNPSDQPPLTIAKSFLGAHAGALGVSPNDIASAAVTNQYRSEHTGVTHIYMRQMVNGLPIANADLNVNVSATGQVINVGSTFAPGVVAADETTIPGFSAVDALSYAANALGVTLTESPDEVIQAPGVSRYTVLHAPELSLDDIPVRLQYVATPAGVELAWNMVLRTTDGEHWYDMSVDADTGEVLYSPDWISNATYHVHAIPNSDPNDGPRTLEVDPHDPLASPFGWHDTSGSTGPEFTDTRGNNVFAQEDIDGNDIGGSRPNGGPGLIFDFPVDLTLVPPTYLSASTTNLFYWNNITHDVMYRYGFTEAAGNFQINNYGRGGLGNDAVQADAHDPSFFGPNFGTPPDGRPPRMEMTLFDFTAPGRDSSLASEIIVHEYGHGVSNRLTGGPANSGALFGFQSRGMGEGWSDYFALAMLQRPTDTELGAYPQGIYVLGQLPTDRGVRAFPYSVDMTIDPDTYGVYNQGINFFLQHRVGKIWASMLWDMTWQLINKWGYDANVQNGFDPIDPFGNTLALQLVMDGLKLQPANPTFVNARDAILLADRLLTGGKNQVELWTAFARRGLGFSAFDGGGTNAFFVTEAFDLPPGLIPNPGQLHGTSYLDVDGDGLRDPGDTGLKDSQIFLDLNEDGDLDAGTSTFTVPGPLALADSARTRSVLQISNFSLPVANLAVTLNITHSNPADLDVFLVSPSKTRVPLFSDIGAPGDSFVNTRLDDNATDSITTATSFTGSFKPQGLLSSFLGEDLNGFWKLEVFDDTTGEVGTLNDWSLHFDFSEPTVLTRDDDAATTLIDEAGTYSFLNVNPGTYLVAEVPQPNMEQTTPRGKLLAITEIRVNFPDGFELQNVSSGEVNTAGWFVAVSDNPFGSINTVNPQLYRLPSSMSSGQLIHVTDTSEVNGFGTNIYWNGDNGRIGSGWVMIVDNLGQIVDWVGWGWTQQQLDSFNVQIDLDPSELATVINVSGLAAHWTGATLPRMNSTGYQRQGLVDTNQGIDFLELPQHTLSNQNANLANPFPFAGAASPNLAILGPGAIITGLDFGNRTVSTGGGGNPFVDPPDENPGDPADDGSGDPVDTPPPDTGGDGTGDDDDPPPPPDDTFLPDVPEFSPITGVSIALYRPQNGSFYLRNTNDSGIADSVVAFQQGLANVIAVIGDWDGDGVSTPGIYDPSTGKFYLRDDNSVGLADHTFQYGPGGRIGWQPVVGDWNGDGQDTVGLYDAARGVVFLRNAHAAGPADEVFFYGPPGAGWQAVAGDWDNDGTSTIGLYNPDDGAFYLRNVHAAGRADTKFFYGPGGPGWKPVVGDWDQDGRDTVGMYVDQAGMFHLRNDNSSGVADLSFLYGPPGSGWAPLAGVWQAGAGKGLRVSGTLSADGDPTQADPNEVTDAQLAAIKTAAIARWAVIGLQAQADALAHTPVVVADLPGNYLAWFENGAIYVDRDAAGRGWFVDATPDGDSEFQLRSDRLLAVDASLASDDVDLLSVLSHELGLVLGRDTVHGSAEDLMNDLLPVSVRRLPK